MGNQRLGSSSNMVVSRTPLRLSFAGGGTDLFAFYSREYGSVLSTTINRYVYVTAKKHGELFNDPIRLNYSDTEMVDSIDEIKNSIIRECLRFIDVQYPIYISIVSDVPASSGLGSSSSFTVGLLNALYALQGERVSIGQLAKDAVHVEKNMLNQPVGKQDHYAAAYGGFNLFRFNPDESVSVTPLCLSVDFIKNLNKHVMLFWTNMVRDSVTILSEQQNETENNFSSLQAMREQALQIQSLFQSPFDPVAIGRLLTDSWKLKTNLASSITNAKLDSWFNLALQAGAYGGKLCGAGGGGFFLFIIDPKKQMAVRNALKDLQEIPIDFESQGSTILLS